METKQINKKKCEHNDGWYLNINYDTIIINQEYTNNNNIAEFICNTIGCNKHKKFRFDIVNIEEVK